MMNEDKLPDTLRMLVSRMQEHPEEFVHPDWNPIANDAWADEPFNEVRWGHIIRSFFISGKEYLFDKEEIDFVLFHYKELLRRQMDNCIVKELVGGERDKEVDFKNRQLELPYTSQSTILRKTK